MIVIFCLYKYILDVITASTVGTDMVNRTVRNAR